MNPLEIISEWFNSQEDQTTKADLARMVSHLLDNDVELSQTEEEAIQLFNDYLNSAGLDKKQIVVRALELRTHIWLHIEDRKDQADWDVILNRRIKLVEAFEKEHPGQNSSLNNDNVPLQAAIWIPWVQNWIGLQDSTLTNKEIMYWYFQKP